MIGFVLASTKIGTLLIEWAWGNSTVFFLYLGPETIMPLASIIATIVGVLLVFWRFIAGAIKKLVRTIRRQPEEPLTMSEFDQSGQTSDPRSKEE